MTTLPNELRIACRQLGRRPVFTATAVLTLAIGMGVNAVAFSVVNGLLFKGTSTSGHPDPGRVLATPGGDEGGNGSLPDFGLFADATRGSTSLQPAPKMAADWPESHRERGAPAAIPRSSLLRSVNNRLGAEHYQDGLTAVVRTTGASSPLVRSVRAPRCARQGWIR